MGCGNTKTVEDEQENQNKQENQNSKLNTEENNNNDEVQNENQDNNNTILANNKKVKISKQINNNNQNNYKLNGMENNTNLNSKNKYYEEYVEENDLYREKEEKEEKEKKVNDEEDERKKQHKKRKQFLANIKFKNLFKTDNIDKNNSSIFIDTTQKVKTTFMPSQKGFPKVNKYNNPIQGEDGPFWEINMEASKNEIMCPLWIEKDKEIIFYINGKWKINDDLECDCNGIPQLDNQYEQFTTNNIKHKFNKGALVGRVIFGEQFQIYDGLRYKSEYDGPLILKMNTHSLWSKDKPSGSLNIKIKGISFVDNIGDIEERIGWWKQLKTIQINNIEDLPDYKIPSLEKMIIILLNKVRYNSKLFAYQYLYNMKELTPNSIKIYNDFINNNKKILPLKINVSIVKLLQKFYTPFISGGDNLTFNNNESLIILKTSKIIKTYLEQSFNEEKKILCVSLIKYNEKSPFHIASRLIFEKQLRENIFKNECEEISMMTIQTKEGFDSISYYTIIILSNEKGNNSIDYSISENIKSFIQEEVKNNDDNNIISSIKININPLPNIFSSKI